MGKTLLQSFSETAEANQKVPAVTSVDDNKALSALMQEMKPHLEDAAKDVLQPRQEAVAQLLKKALH